MAALLHVSLSNLAISRFVVISIGSFHDLNWKKKIKLKLLTCLFSSKNIVVELKLVGLSIIVLSVVATSDIGTEWLWFWPKIGAEIKRLRLKYHEFRIKRFKFEFEWSHATKVALPGKTVGKKSRDRRIKIQFYIFCLINGNGLKIFLENDSTWVIHSLTHSLAHSFSQALDYTKAWSNIFLRWRLKTALLSGW